MPPPKRMTANPVRPARHRAGKPGAAPVESSSSEESDDEESEQPQTQSKPAISRPSASSFPKEPSQISSSLKRVDISAEQPAVGKKVQFTNQSETEEESSNGSDESDEESGSDEETSEEESSSEDEAARRKLLRPIFIKKGARNGNAAADTRSEDRRIAEEEAHRKARTDAMIQEELEKKAQARAEDKIFWDDDKVVDDVDDTDGLDLEAEYMAWTIRALKRQKRDEEERLRGEKEREELERWRSLPAEQREAEIQDRLRKQQDDKDSRSKMSFMQKYHHGGAFYQDSLEEAGLAGRDIMGAKYEDDVNDRSALPQFMQIRDMTKLGRKGRTKYRDLKTEDTGRFGDLPDKRRSDKAGYGLDDRFQPDYDRDGSGATGANASSLGERRRREPSDQRDVKRQRID
jgi:microfibrillar-associated protein 1